MPAPWPEATTDEAGGPSPASAVETAAPAPHDAHPALSQRLVLLMAGSASVCVANLFYCQPLLAQIRATFGVSEFAASWVNILTQVGYALGMLLIVPAGDMFERRRLVVIFTLLAAGSCVLLACAPTLAFAAGASLLIGVTSMTAQLVLPFAAHLAKPHRRGKVIGTIVSGILLGVLLARTASGYVSAAWGWRAVYWIAAGAMTGLAGVLGAALPRSKPTFHGTYAGLFKTIHQLIRTQPVLREASFFGGAFFGAFSAFWGTFINLVVNDFGDTPDAGARKVGAYALLGAFAVLAAPIVGTLTHRYRPRPVSGVMIAITGLSFVLFWFARSSLLGLAVAIVVMDIGVQCGHVLNQTRTFPLVPGAQSRLQTVYMTSYFLGGSFGSIVASWAWTHWGWLGVCATGLGIMAAAGARFLAINGDGGRGPVVPTHAGGPLMH